MRKSTGLVAVLLTVVLLSLPEGYVSRADDTDFHTALLRSTFKIVGDDGYVGTAFIIGRESVTEGRKTYVPVLVTAAHVLEKIPGDNATLVLRRKHGDEFLRVEHTIPVRRDGKKIWTAHPGEDVAAMPVRFPDDADLLLISDGLLAADNSISERGIHPGTEVLTIGFPFGFEGNPAGFPVVRSDRISSYPLLPTKKTRTFIVDFNVFGGNSGGPVYICDGGRHGRGPGDARTPANVPMVMGLVSARPWRAIGQALPVLTLEQVYGALTFYLSHQQTVDDYLAAQRTDFEARRQAAREADPKFYHEARGGSRHSHRVLTVARCRPPILRRLGRFWEVTRYDSRWWNHWTTESSARRAVRSTRSYVASWPRSAPSG